MQLVSWPHLCLQLSQLSLQLGRSGLQLLFSALKPLLTLSDGSVHLDPELCSETIFTLSSGDKNQELIPK